MIHVGLTGGLCSGKSTVAAMFAELGAPVIDADALVHELLGGQGEVGRRVAAAFGEGVCGPDGSIDRAKLARIVFADEDKLAALTGILYPAVREHIAHWFSEQKNNGAPAAIAEVSMLFEGGAADRYDVIIVVSADLATRLARFVERGGTAEGFAERLQHQMGPEEQEKKANYVITNNQTREATHEQVIGLWAVLQKTHAGGTRAGKEEL